MSTSKKEEERNEKIIRGLMKLPPNRRCINCNSLGPQYVCTNFWTFICITCSGIHREFTHRVKSVSMSKFTSQEVDSLQRGGNQRARETFLKDWDIHRQRLPSSSNVEKVREFIKNVYVDRKYAGGNSSEKPPRDTQALRNHEDEARRASSYHSYSQSPPYEYQYEDRKYGRQAGGLTRRPGSDRGRNEGKISRLVYSPGRLGEQAYEDRFANEGSVSRVSDYSAYSGGDPFRSGATSPNLQEVGVSSPPSLPVRDILNEDARRQTSNSYPETNTKADAHKGAYQQRSASLSSFGSFDSNSILDVVAELKQSTGTQSPQLSSVPSIVKSDVSVNNATLDPLSPPHMKHFPTFSAQSIDFFQPQTTFSDPPVDLFANVTNQQLSTASLEQKQPAVSFADNEGWATFDSPQKGIPISDTKNLPAASTAAHDDATPFGNFDVLPSTSASIQWTSVPDSSGHGPYPSLDSQWNTGPNDVHATPNSTSTDLPMSDTKNLPTASMAAHGDATPFGNFNILPSTSASIQWMSVPDSSGHGPYPSLDQWNTGPNDVQATPNSTSTEQWNTFEDPVCSVPHATFGNMMYENETQAVAYAPSSDADRSVISSVLEESSTYEVQRENPADAPPFDPPFGAVNGSLDSSVFSAIGQMPPHATEGKSTNPFDFPYESDFHPTNMFLDMSSLQSALPDPELQPAFLDDLSQPWFAQNSVAPYDPTIAEGGLAFMAGEAPTQQLPTLSSQEPVASVGGNPFA